MILAIIWQRLTESMAKTASKRLLSDLPTGKYTTLQTINPAGSLLARRDATGAIYFYWRYSMGEKSERPCIGLYDKSAEPRALLPTENGYSMAAAIHVAQKWATQHVLNKRSGGLPALKQAREDAERSSARAKLLAKVHTLANLLDDYCEHQRSQNRKSAGDARSIFNLHIKEAFPTIASLPAKDVTPEHFVEIMRKLMTEKKGRTANKLRSYARSAYQLAKSAKRKASVPAKFKDYQITNNPVAETDPDETQNRPDKNPLSVDELRAYWSAIKDRTDLAGAILRFHLLTGAQRIEQLVNLRTKDIASWDFVIHDGKGRPGTLPRPHKVPATTPAREALKACNPRGEFALSTDGGQTHVSASTFTGWAKAANRDIKNFKPKRLRSGVETLLSSEGVQAVVRGHLQSHGIGGVQARHYDGHEYMSEKRKALHILFDILEAEIYAEPIPESVALSTEIVEKSRSRDGIGSKQGADSEISKNALLLTRPSENERFEEYFEVDLSHLDALFPPMADEYRLKDSVEALS